MEVESSQPRSTVFEPGLCKPVPTSATSTISNKSIYSEITPSHGKLGAEEQVLEEEDVAELVELKGTKEWVRRQHVEQEATLLARQQEPDNNTQEEVNASILHLQSLLQEQSTKLSVQELVLERLQCGDVLSKLLFDSPDSESTEEEPSEKDKEKIGEMVKQQNELVFELGKYHKDIQDLQENLDEVKKQSFEQQVRNRELMTRLQQRKEEQQQRSQEDSSDKVKMLESKLQQAMSNISSLQHIFQALIFGSQVHWAEDPDLQDLMISLGTPPDI
ncbi:centromere protein H-like [Branchiostoma lanceolatum]|uniref:centromere protein H-like n=1 Tax=Branchiostoma lanceolatum TaxID=7740 RepID=UPI003451EFB1